MAYVKIMYQNSPSTATPINAENLNHMDNQIALNDQRLTTLEGAHVSSFNGRTGAVTPESGDYDINQIVASDGQEGYIPVWRNRGTEQEPDWGFEMEEQGGSGHEILDADGTAMAQEDAMQFLDSFLSDDSTNGKTIVENIKEVDPADYDSTTDEGIIVCDDGNDVPIGEIEEDVVSVTADGVKTYSELLNELYTLIDSTKLTDSSYIPLGNKWFKFGRIVGGGYYFATSAGDTSAEYNDTIAIRQTNSNYVTANVTYSSGVWSITNNSSTIPSNGTVIYLHYGTSSGIVELNTDARHCMMSDGVTSVEQKIDNLIKVKIASGTTNSDGALEAYTDITPYSRVIAVRSKSANRVCLDNGSGWVLFKSTTSLSALVNDSVECYVYYM